MGLLHSPRQVFKVDDERALKSVFRINFTDSFVEKNKSCLATDVSCLIEDTIDVQELQKLVYCKLEHFTNHAFRSLVSDK